MAESYTLEQVNGEIEGSDTKSSPSKKVSKMNVNLIYGIDDIPPIGIMLMLGFQHFIMMFSVTFVVPFLFRDMLCIPPTDGLPIAQLIGTLTFVSGVATLMQVTMGVRLPIVQGGSAAWFFPTFAVLEAYNEKTTCEESYEYYKALNQTTDHAWHDRMRQVQGSMIVASLTQCLLGATGLAGLLSSRVRPITIFPTIALISLSVVTYIQQNCEKFWPLAIVTIAVFAICSQFLKNISIPVPGTKDGVRVFGLFPVVFAIAIACFTSAVLTLAGFFPHTPEESESYYGRIDVRAGVLMETSWARIPYPFQWGVPTVNGPGAVGMFFGVLASVLESIGDYKCCGNICQVGLPPKSAVNRGILFEGLGCLMAGIFGSGNGSTSYSDNICAIGYTRTASRAVIVTCAGFMLSCSVLLKVCALFSCIPDPVVGGLLVCGLSMLFGVAFSNLQDEDISSSRSIFIGGFSIIIGLTVPRWLRARPVGYSLSGLHWVDVYLQIILKSEMITGGITAFTLDNIIPEEPVRARPDDTCAQSKGLEVEVEGEGSSSEQFDYDGPLYKKLAHKLPFAKKLPVIS